MCEETSPAILAFSRNNAFEWKSKPTGHQTAGSNGNYNYILFEKSVNKQTNAN